MCIRDRAKPVVEPPVVETTAGTPASAASYSRPLIEAKLPKGLAGAKPRYKTTELQFDDDIDKALYIVGNEKTQSKSHDAYMNFLREHMYNDDSFIARTAAAVSYTHLR